ncbi:MAG: TonB-dependent receptor plug domain-containing protein [Woeseiaceae bacterium]|nr:TonB-dependent receptor plug domain-containing protein [Woeseiaceae bacterium]
MGLGLVTALSGWHSTAHAQEEGTNVSADVEEVIVTGRFISSSQQLINERMDDAFATDLLGADTISRLGDSTVAGALRRIPGLTLVQDKYVYIRGLGERYSQTTLNGAYIPSVDLTRNVIPLNVFPTSVVESLRVQKSYSPELSANFGGGAVDIRTKGIPDGFTLKFEAGIAFNDENPSDVLTYKGGGDDSLGTDDGTRKLSRGLINGVVAFQGNPNVNNINSFLHRQDPTSTLFDAQTVNRQLGAELNREVAIRETSADPDYDLRASVGNTHEIGADWDFGWNVGGSYETDWRWRRTRTATFGEPEEENGVREETTRSVNITGTLNLGLKFAEDHELETTSLFLRNTDDETEVFDFFNENNRKSDGQGFRDYRLEFEERNMTTHQIAGTHYLGSATRELLGGMSRLIDWLPEETSIEWFYSDSTAETDIPNRVVINSETVTDPVTGRVLSDRVTRQSSAAEYRFTELEDEVENYGWKGTLPISLRNSYLEVSGGYDHAQKVRTYEQSEFSLGFLSVVDQSVLEGPLDQVFSDENLFERFPDDPLTQIDESLAYVNDVQFDRQGSNTNSYLAATVTDSMWGKVDWTYKDSWRFAVGARWEDYRQVAVEWNPWGFSEENPQVTTDPAILEERTFTEDEYYPAASVTYMTDWLAETFQLRLGYSETAVRPDLRELTGSSYIDPITGDLVRGNPGVVPSKVDNIDLRAEWFLGNGDNFTITLFQKDIEDPIEFFEIPASDTTIAREILNADSSEVRGIEIEGLKELAFLGGIFDTMFVQGNLTLQETELVPGNPNDPNDSGTTQVSCFQTETEGQQVRVVKNKCQLSGASEYVANFMLGFDSYDSKHTGSLIYNVFGERVFAFGRFGPDAIEQPFKSLDATYFWYPTDRFTVKAKAQNILGDTIEITRSEPGRKITVFEEDPGTTYSVAFSWEF